MFTFIWEIVPNHESLTILTLLLRPVGKPGKPYFLVNRKLRNFLAQFLLFFFVFLSTWTFLFSTQHKLPVHFIPVGRQLCSEAVVPTC